MNKRSILRSAPAPRKVTPKYFIDDLPTLVEICQDGTQICRYSDGHYEATVRGKNVVGTLEQIYEAIG